MVEIPIFPSTNGFADWHRNITMPQQCENLKNMFKPLLVPLGLDPNPIKPLKTNHKPIKRFQKYEKTLFFMKNVILGHLGSFWRKPRRFGMYRAQPSTPKDFCDTLEAFSMFGWPLKVGADT